MVKTSRFQRANHGIHLRLQDVYVGNGSISLSFCPALEHGSGPSLTKLEARTYERGRTLPAALESFPYDGLQAFRLMPDLSTVRTGSSMRSSAPPPAH